MYARPCVFVRPGLPPQARCVNHRAVLSRKDSLRNTFSVRRELCLHPGCLAVPRTSERLLRSQWPHTGTCCDNHAKADSQTCRRRQTFGRVGKLRAPDRPKPHLLSLCHTCFCSKAVMTSMKALHPEPVHEPDRFQRLTPTTDSQRGNRRSIPGSPRLMVFVRELTREGSAPPESRSRRRTRSRSH